MTGLAPIWSISITADDYMVSTPTQAMIRLHKAIAKRSLRATLLDHYYRNFKRHFMRGNRSRYSHKERMPKYRHRRKKEFGSTTDLVKTGESKRYMTNQVPTVSTSYVMQGGLRGRMTIKWPPSMRTKAARLADVGVNFEQMNKELETWANDEALRSTNLFYKLYVDDLRVELDRRPKLRKNYHKKL